MLINTWMDKQLVYSYKEDHSSVKSKELLTHVTTLYLRIIMLSDGDHSPLVSQRGINLSNNTL